MVSKTRLSSYCTKRANNGVNLVTSRKINTRLARPIVQKQTRNISNDCIIKLQITMPIKEYDDANPAKITFKRSTCVTYYNCDTKCHNSKEYVHIVHITDKLAYHHETRVR